MSVSGLSQNGFKLEKRKPNLFQVLVFLFPRRARSDQELSSFPEFSRFLCLGVLELFVQLSEGVFPPCSAKKVRIPVILPL